MMNEVNSLLVTVDFPDAITRGLRPNTDILRGVLERTHGDLTLAPTNAASNNASPASKTKPTTEAPSAGPFAS